jgi:putative tryptophan/tyrosine transport system substrate-binding protein
LRGALFDYKETERVARKLRIELQSVEVSRAEDLDRAIAMIGKQRPQGLIVQTPNPVLFVNPGQIARLAQNDRLPSIFGQVEFANAGGLMSYGSNTTERYRQAATFVAKILKGAKPAELPVEQPTRFELVINLKTAKAIGLAIPRALLVLADKVIE